ncbi:MAG TPA: ABC transporter permease [Atribacter sp.]|jgi:ABC-type nitrate/sulfonate/bicarbonate transport system permease component|uniref:Putative aliphatic sulfonates transport permease protein SsuC n=1 Tax=Candidatus Atribacter allofermentans TaxID=1852833 RepID=A0A1V5T5B0_9BACT|nr:ABC transporter permease [Atribacter sp.]MDD3714642.1 ABC transporter permease [Atribacterota bacterium]MDI9593991.1 ABC transporter permease [Atribacterota bacterium]OQA61601.1 MAG: putative aliphatic sulfonates transport permease protein SsuC [Candidatus Atribacteria bacterium ADurb.Bin276]HQK83486.1 ABC transporter permease [Atribacter sp.]
MSLSSQSIKGGIQKKESKKRTNGWIPALVSFAIFIICWYFLTKYFIPPIKFPTPLMVINAFYELRFTVLNHIGATMFRVLTGFLVGSIAGIGFGLFMGLNPSVNKYLNPLVESSRPVPPIATIPFFILWFGIGDLGKILLIIVGCALVMIVNTVEAIRNVPPIYVKAAQTLGARNNSIYKTIIMPAIIPHIIAGLRVASALSFSLAIAAEYMGAQSGIGYVVMLARRTLKTENIMLGILLLGILSSLLDTGIRLVGNYLTRWSERLPS